MRHKLAHRCIAGCTGATAKNNCDDGTTVQLGRGCQIAARRTGIASLDSINAANGANQTIVVADDLLAEIEGAGVEIPVILREMLAIYRQL